MLGSQLNSSDLRGVVDAKVGDGWRQLRPGERCGGEIGERCGGEIGDEAFLPGVLRMVAS